MFFSFLKLAQDWIKFGKNARSMTVGVYLIVSAWSFAKARKVQCDEWVPCLWPIVCQLQEAASRVTRSHPEHIHTESLSLWRQMCFALSGQCFRTKKHTIIKNYHQRLRGKHFPSTGFLFAERTASVLSSQGTRWYVPQVHLKPLALTLTSYLT